MKKDYLEKLLNKLLSTGADFAEIYEETCPIPECPLKKYINCSEDKNIQTSDFNEWNTILNKYTNNDLNIRDLKTNLKSLKFVQYKMP